jgi:DNA-binding beta-propeller fold protein YncE
MLTALAIGGCAQPKPPPLGPIFYPPAPDAPRLQYLTTIASADAWMEQPRSSFADFILGSPKDDEGEGRIKGPYGLALRNGKIYVCDLGRYRVHVIDMVTNRYAVLGTPDQIAKPTRIVIAPDGTKYVSDSGKRRVAVFNAEDRFVRHLGDPERCAPIDLAIWKDELFVADALGGKIEVWDKNGNLKRVISSKGEGPHQLKWPAGLAIGPQGHLFVTDMELATVKEFDTAGKYIKSIGEAGDRPGYFARPKGIAIDGEGRIYVADAQWDKVQIFNPDGQLLLYFGVSTAKPHGLVTPTGLAIDATSVDAFRKHVHEDFVPEYLVAVANQFGINKIVVHAYGKGVAKPIASTDDAASPPAEEAAPAPADVASPPPAEEPAPKTPGNP